MEKLDFSFRKTNRWLGLLTFCMMLFVGQMGFAQQCEIAVTISSVGYGDATTWELRDGSNTIVLSGGNYGFAFEDTQNYIAINPPYTLSITIDDFGWCDNSIDYTVTVGGNPDISGTVDAVCDDIFTWDIPLNADLTACIPTCPAPTALTASNPTLTSIDLSWDGVGGASGNYEIKWGAVGFDIDAATATPVTGLTYTLAGTVGESYQFIVREICDINDESSWSAPYSFFIPNLGEDCSAPIVIGALPYTTTDDTVNYTDNINIEGSPGSSGCGTTSSYLNGNDVVYAYTAAFDGVIQVKMTPSGTWSGIFAYADCADIGTACIGGASNSGSAVNMFELNVADGDTYYFVISTWASPQTVAYTLDISQVLCPKPTGVAHTDVTQNSANVSWDVLGNYEINWGTGTFVAGEGANTDTVNATTEFAFSGLNGSTLYRYFVRQNCGGASGNSEWVGPYTFTTLAAPASIPWMEGFTTTTMPTGWAQTGFLFGVATGITDAPGGVEGNVIYKNLWGSGTSGNFQTIRAGLVSDGDILSFIYKTNNYSSPYAPPAIGSGNFIVAISTDNGVNYTNIQTITNDGVSEGWQNFEYDLSSYEGEYVRIRISATRTAGDYYLAFDNFYVGQPITCEAPTALTATNITTNTANLSWTSEGSTFDISWGAGAFDAEDGTIVALANGGTLSGLTAQTTYQYYVRQNCGIGDFSLWAGPFSFTTDCDPFTSINENFDSYTTGNIVPDCWVRLVPATSVGSQTITSTTPASGTRNIYQNATTTQNPVIVVLPSFSNVNDGTHWLKFKARVSSGAPGSLHVGYVTDHTDYNSFVLIETLAITNTSYTADAEYTVEIPTSVPAGAKLAVKNAADGKSYYWDDVIWEQAPSCIPPSALTVSNITANTADLSWTSEGSTFDISWGAGAFDAEDGTIVAFANGGTLSGLAPQTAYQYYVRQNCGVGDVSMWVGPFSFTTLCVPVAVLPYTENFDTYGTGSNAFPDCWERPVTYDSGTVWPSIVAVPGSSTPNSLRFQSLTTEPTYAVSPAFAEDINNLRVRFNLRREGTSSGTIDIGVMSDPSDLNSFELIQTINPTETTFIEYTINLNNTTLSGSNNYIAFRHNSNASYYYYWLDDFVVELLPSCIEPSALTATNITANTADLSWTSEGSTFDISWGTGTFDAEDGTIVSLVNGGTLSGLAPQTAYQYYVRQNCGIGDVSMWAGPFGFTTDCTSFTSLDEDFDSYTTGSIVPDCWVRLVPATSVGSQTITSTSPASGTRNIYQYAGATQNPVIVVLPSVSNLNDGLHIFEFKARVGSGAPGALHVGYVTDHTDYNSFVLIETLAITNTTYASDADYSVIIPTSVPAGAKLAIKNAADGKSYYWDDVIVRELGDLCTGTPEAGIATASMSSGESGSSVDFAVTGYDNTAEGLSYDWEYSTDSGASWESIGTSDDEVTFTITDPIGTVFQVRYAATCSFSELTSYSNIVTFTVTQPLEYCTPTYGTSTSDRLSVVNTTGATSNLNYTSDVGGQHFDETAMVLEAAPGQEFTLNTTYVGGGQTVGVWIDWENNNTFDDLGNRIALNYSSSLTQSFTVTIPSDATPGDYRLRVRGSWSNHTADGDIFACNSKSYGSSVDFTIRVATSTAVTWTTSDEWSNVIGPTINDDVVIEGDLLVGTDVASFEAKTLTVVSGGAVYIESGNSVTVAGAINNQAGADNFIVESGANLVQTDDVDNTGDITVEVKAMTEWFGYNMFSSPVAGQSLGGIFTNGENNGNEYLTYSYTDENTHSWEATTDTAFELGLGYLYAAPITAPLGELASYNYEFTGVPNNGNVTINVANTSFKALGNPYPSAIDANEFISHNSSVGAIHIWRNEHFYNYGDGAGEYAGVNYITINDLATVGAEGGNIEAGQGFVVATDAGTIEFTNEMRLAESAGVFYKPASSDKHILWLNLYNENNMLNQIAVGYAEGATEGYDNQMDAKMFGYDGTALYSIITGEQDAYAIQGRSLPFTNADIVPLGFRAIEGGSYAISLANFDGLFAEGQDIFLKDNLTESLIDLKEEDYTFVSEPGVFDARFEVVYNTTMSVNNPTLDNNWVVYKQNGSFQILSQGFDISQVTVFDMLGRTIYQSEVEGASHQLPEMNANGVLIIRVNSVDNGVSTKKVIN